MSTTMYVSVEKKDKCQYFFIEKEMSLTWSPGSTKVYLPLCKTRFKIFR